MKNFAMRKKKGVFFTLSIIIYVIVCAVIYYCVPIYIQEKKETGRSEAYYNIYQMAKYNDKYLDLEFHNSTNLYEQIPIPEVEEPTSKDIIDRIGAIEYINTGGEDVANQIRMEREKAWLKKYENATELYNISVYPDGPDFLQRYGWALKIIEYKKNISTEIDGYMEYFIIPTQVILKQPNVWVRFNVNDVIEKALEYIIYEDRDLKNYYKKGAIIDFKNEIGYRVNNEFYNLSQDVPSRIKFFKDGDKFGLHTSENDISPYYTITHPCYDVLISRTQPKTYSLKLIDEEEINNKIRNLRLRGIIYASVFFIGLMVILLIVFTRTK